LVDNLLTAKNEFVGEIVNFEFIDDVVDLDNIEFIRMLISQSTHQGVFLQNSSYILIPKVELIGIGPF
jgi:hypothetical protein